MSTRIARLFVVMSLITIAFAQEKPAGDKVGILIMAHGGTPEWNAAVEDAVAPLREHCPVVIAYGMAEPASLQPGVAELETMGVNKIAVVRAFISGESFLHQTEYLLGLRPDAPAYFVMHDHAAMKSDKGDAANHASAHAGHSMDQSGNHGNHGSHDSGDSQSKPDPINTSSQLILSQPGLVDSPLMAGILRERVKALSKNPAEESVLILGHGVGDDRENDALIAKMGALTGGINELGKFREVRAETLREDWPDKRKPAEDRIRAFVAKGNENGGNVIVVPFRLFGFGEYNKVLEGLTYVSEGKGLLPHPIITDWLKAQAVDCVQRAGWESPFAAN
jgi:sirohydrochlorin ferrochelatase